MVSQREQAKQTVSSVEEGEERRKATGRTRKESSSQASLRLLIEIPGQDVQESTDSAKLRLYAGDFGDTLVVVGETFYAEISPMAEFVKRLIALPDA